MHPGGGFVGSKACADCHAKAYEVWEKSKHHEALKTLVASGDQADPECLVCHVVGLGYVSGFRTAKETPGLGGVGCENCHGPGAKHVEGQAASEIEPGGEDNCRTCHTQLQSPTFDYREAFESIAHPDAG